VRGIAHLTAGWAAAFVFDPDGITRTKTLGTERMTRKLADALPGGSNPLRAAVWEFLRPMLWSSPEGAPFSPEGQSRLLTWRMRLEMERPGHEQPDLGAEASARWAN